MPKGAPGTRPKGGKSSASAGTRKKHARKAAKDADDDDAALQPQQQQQRKKQRGQKKLSKAQRKALPKIKQYIPPPKPPAPPIPDPLDGLGLARTLPAELVVVLRRLGKKDDVTRRKGLDELREQWVATLLQRNDRIDGDEADGEEEVTRELSEAALLAAVPVWLHNLASLLQSPSHRSQALQVHDELLQIPSLRGAILDAIALGYLPGTQGRDILGSWLVAALEEGRRAGGQALKVWERVVRFGPGELEQSDEGPEHCTAHIDLVPHLPSMAEYLSLSILDPQTLHRDIHPAPVQFAFAAPASKAKDAKGGTKGKGGRVSKTASPAPTETPPVEEDSEVTEERWARYRVGGLVGLAWIVRKLGGSGLELPDEFRALLTNPVLWSALGTTSHLRDVSPIGQQPPIRRAAYVLLSTLLDTFPAEVQRPELLSLLAATVLGNCWAEKEAVVWEAAGPAIIKLLTKHPQSWILAESASGDDDGDKDDDDEDDDDDDDEDDGDDDDDETEPPSRQSGAATPATVDTTSATPAPPSSKAFDAFLHFISSICLSVPHLTYPLLVVVISTIPPSLLQLSASSPPLQNLFSHMWSPVDARLLSTHAYGAQPSAFQVFLQAAVDATVFLAERASKNGSDAAVWLVKEQLGGRAWAEGIAALGGKGGRRGATPVETEAGIVARGAAKVVALSLDLASLFMMEVERTTIDSCFPPDGKSSTFLSRALAALTVLRQNEPLAAAIDATILKVADGCSERLFEHLASGSAPTAYVEALIGILTNRGDLFPAERIEVLSQGLQAHIPDLVSALPSRLVASLFDATAALAGPADRDALIAALWAYIEGSTVEQSTRFALAAGVLGVGATQLLPAKSLDPIAAEATRAALAVDDETALDIASAAVTSSDWLSSDAKVHILDSVCASVQDAVDGLLTEGAETTLPSAPLQILAAYADRGIETLVASDECIHAVVAAHHLVILLPRLALDAAAPAAVTKLWSATANISAALKERLSAAVSRSLAEMLGRVSCRVDPGTLVDVALATDQGVSSTPAEVASTLLPTPEDMLAQLARHTAQPPHPTLPVIDALVPCEADVAEPTTRPSDFDAAGRSRAARYAEAALALLRADRALVQTFPQLLHLALGAMILAEDAAAIPGASRGLYTPATPAALLEQVVRDAEGALSFSLSLVDEAPLAWHKATVDQLRAGKPAANADYLQRLLADLGTDVAARTSDVAPRAFRDVLRRHLRKCEAGEAEGEVWLNYAMAMSEKMPEIAHAVILAIKPIMLDSKAFATAQNRLASALTGIRVAAVNDKGIPALRLLVASAPPADSAALFIPQQRAVFVLRHVGGWLTSDDEAADDFADELDVRVAEMYTALAPIVQDLSGGHWDAIFDLIESALGACALDDQASFPLLYATLLLLKEVRDLCTTNKALRALWTAKDVHLGLVVKLFVQCRDADSVPLQLIHALILDLLADASPEAMAQAGLPELCVLLSQSSSAPIQTTAYRLLSQVVKQRTLALVLEVEASVADKDEQPRQRDITIPDELMAIVDAGRDVDWHMDPDIPTVMAQLLAWMAIMDHFDDASRTVRWAYLDQLNSSRLLGQSFLPLLFAMLGVSEVGAWNFPASQYAVDEFYPDLLEPESLPDLTPLASYVFYRALVTVPQAMRAYYESLKDRQLSLSLVAFTSKNYSPVIIQHEFSALREPRALAELTDEGLSVRIAQGGGSAVAGAGAAEAIASYVVDEQPMEIGIRLPAEFPLKAVDVRDLRRVGVPENKWRGWLMSVQQTITSRNGLILEALTVFKKNVALHFEGVVECAICYSIISVTDRTLPTKPCKTCKNRFHASCLFKWFNSSHSSSCPMCRSLF